MYQSPWVERSSSWPPFSAGTCPSSIFSTRKLMSLCLATIHCSLRVNTELEMGWGCHCSVRGPLGPATALGLVIARKTLFGKQFLQDEGRVDPFHSLTFSFKTVFPQTLTCAHSVFPSVQILRGMHHPNLGTSRLLHLSLPLHLLDLCLKLQLQPQGGSEMLQRALGMLSALMEPVNWPGVCSFFPIYFNDFLKLVRCP